MRWRHRDRRGDGARGRSGATKVGSGLSSLHTESKALKGGTAPRENRLAIGGNVVNPRVGRRVQHLATFEVEKTVAVV